MYFGLLQQRLIEQLKKRVQNGDFSERGLARLTGVSQPHMHNSLRGARIFSPEICDQILRSLGMNLLELFEKEELEGLAAMGGRYREIPVLEGWVGPGFPVPVKVSAFERHAFPISQGASLAQAVFARLRKDQRMGASIRENDLALLDRSPAKRTDLNPASLYVVNYQDEGLVRRLRREESSVLLVAEDDDPEERAPLAGRHLLDIVKAKVVWIGRVLV